MSKKIMSLVKLLIINLKNMNIYLFSHITLFTDRSESYILAIEIYSVVTIVPLSVNPFSLNDSIAK